jgi:hypothetical protein
VVSGHYLRAGAATITVRGKQGGREVAFQAPVVLPERDERPAVASVWARTTIAELSRQQLRGERPELRKQITDLALSHRLMSPYTAFVVVDRSRVTAGGVAETVAVPVEIPEAVGREDAGGVQGGVVGGLVGGELGGAVAEPMPAVSRSAGAPKPDAAAPPPALASAHRKSLAKCLDGQTGSGTMNVRLEVDGAGNVKDAHVTGVSASVASCATVAARKLKVNAAQPAAIEADFAYSH